LGGDFAPNATLHGALMALKELPSSDRIVLIGEKDIILAFLKEENVSPSKFEIVDAPDLIEMDESPTKALVNKPNSSISTGFRLLKHEEINSFASAGSSGAMLVGAIYSVGNIQGIIRPSSPAYIAKENGGMSILIDVGTNPDAKPDVMYQFGLLGSLFAEHVFHVKNPRVGLLSIGSEEKKGSLTTQSAFQLMKESKDYNFIGNVEAMYRVLVKRGIKDSYLDRFNYEIYGGTPILGVNGNVIVGHGISNSTAIKNMILLSRDIHEAKLPGRIKHALEQYTINNF